MRYGKVSEHRVMQEGAICMMSLDVHVLSCVDNSVYGGDADGCYHGSDSLKSLVHRRVFDVNNTMT
jgi:hypothetical protein